MYKSERVYIILNKIYMCVSKMCGSVVYAAVRHKFRFNYHQC